ncbi:MAG: trypsin-like serine protease [Clostridiales bacterium]|nr:trypsin-like serine protease [Clostridiales bacterium]
MKSIMKKKVVISIFVFTIIVSLLSLGFNMYFLATKPKSPSGIFNSVKNSILEIKAETENVGESYGSAVIISEDGTIITNAHVVTYKQLGESHVFDNISVRFIDEESFRKVNIIKYDIDLDIAILKIECDRNLSPIKFGDDSKLKHGDSVYAIGNMSNYGISITSGIVSIPHINVSYEDKIRNVIQCDITISDGNSGGALVDQNGKLLGLTTFRLKDKSNNVIYGISYSIPAGTIMEYIKN